MWARRYRPFRRTSSTVCALALLVVANLCVQTISLHADIIDRILAVVGGEMITLSDVNAALRLGLIRPPGDGDPVRAALDALIDRRMELMEVNRYQPPDPSPESIEQRMSALRARFPAPADFDRTLAQTGVTVDQLRERLRDDERIQAYLGQRFGAGLQVSDADVVAYYRAHQADFSTNGVVRPYADVREQIRTIVVNEKRQELIKDWLVGLRRRAEITDLYLTAR